MSTNMNKSQKEALSILGGNKNVFLSGAAGTGKSTVLREFVSDHSLERIPLLASSGAAAVLIGGRTFHSFFGIGILEGGVETSVQRALGSDKVVGRLRAARGVVIDEVSMLPGKALEAAEKVARMSREVDLPWGGLKVIVVGDFGQLPPVSPFRKAKDWAFLHPVWEMSNFVPAILTEVMRANDRTFLSVLAKIANGEVDDEVSSFLDSRCVDAPEEFDGTRLFSKRDHALRCNRARLEELPGEEVQFKTRYKGKKEDVEKLKRHCPLDEVIHLKIGALIMARSNDESGRYVNGSQGRLVAIDPEKMSLTVQLHSGIEVVIEQKHFDLLGADGEKAATAINFPVSLAWATTIHKAQGATLEKVRVDLRGLWDPGQAYVALSRVQSPSDLYLDGWDRWSIITDPKVKEFHETLKLMSQI